MSKSNDVCMVHGVKKIEGRSECWRCITVGVEELNKACDESKERIKVHFYTMDGYDSWICMN